MGNCTGKLTFDKGSFKFIAEDKTSRLQQSMYLLRLEAERKKYKKSSRREIDNLVRDFVNLEKNSPII